MPDEYEVDAISAASPDMSGGEMDALKESIATIGQQVPIFVWQGRVIDGRKRLACCKALGVEPRVTVLADSASPQDHAAALNLLRTHYTPSQRTMFAAEMANATQADAVRMRDDRSSYDNQLTVVTVQRAAREMGVSAPAVQRAKAVRRDGAPEVTEAVKAGRLTVHAARQIVKTVPIAEQPVVVQRVIDASQGKARQTPVARVIDEHADARRDRAQPKPGHEQFARSVQSMEVLADVMARNVGAVALDARRKQLLESLRFIRTTITRVINNMENVA